MEYRYILDDRVIAREIKAARKAANLTQVQLAEKVNLSLNSVSKLETNLMHASLQTLVLLANALDMDINYLLSSRQDIDSEDENTELLFESLISNLSMRDKEFLIYIINGLDAYNSAESIKDQTENKLQTGQQNEERVSTDTP